MNRAPAATLCASAAFIVALAVNEGYSGTAYKDVAGVATIGYGQADGTKMGDKTDPVRALKQLDKSVDEHARGMVACINVPISQGEYDAYLDFSYNVGVSAFCNSTLNKKLNSGDYAGACKELLKWNKADGFISKGLTTRRQQEYQKCSQV